MLECLSVPIRTQLKIKTVKYIIIIQKENIEENQRIEMKKYLTSVIAIHNINGQLGKWPGPIIEANSLEEADEWCNKNTQYLFVEQEVLDIKLSEKDSSALN
jgi:hypothetical protein